MPTDINLTDQVQGVLSQTHGGTGQTSVSPTPAASAVVAWDANSNLSASTFIAQETVTAASATTITMTIASTQVQTITGSGTSQTVVLPYVSVKAGQIYTIINQVAGGLVTVQTTDGYPVAILAPGQIGVFTAVYDTPSAFYLWSGNVGITDSVFGVVAGAITLTTAGTQVVYTLPAATDTLTGVAASQTLTNKTLTSPTLTTPILGTPTSGTLTNCTGLPLAGLASAAYNTTPAASTLIEWDTNKNLSANNFFTPAPSAIATSSLPVSLTIASPGTITLTGSTAGTLTLPSTSVPAGGAWMVENNSTAIVTVNASAGAVVILLAAGTAASFQAINATPTLPSNWTVGYGAVSVASGKSLNVLNSITIGGTDGTALTFPYATTSSEYIGNNAGGGTLTVTNAIVPTGITGGIVTVINPGAGGASGRVGATSSVCCGGGGGGGAAAMYAFLIPASAWGSNYSLAIPAPGAGGAAIVSTANNGNAGGTGAGATFSTAGGVSMAFANCAGGVGGTNALGTGGAAAPGMVVGTAGGSASTTGGIGTAGTTAVTGGPPGGGAGGGVSAANLASNGGAGARAIPIGQATTIPPGGTTAGVSPGAGTPISGFATQSGGGGAGSITGNGQNGANGGGYGSGGGGGGGANVGFNSGAGGNGGPGYIYIQWLYNY